MFQLAIPISHLFYNKQDAIDICTNSDCLECREKSSDLEYPKQYLFHLDIDIIHK